MTVCIAALYGDGAGAVLVSDKMVTAHIPIGYEFEHGEATKIVKVGENVYALVAGDVLRGNEVLSMARAQLAQRDGATVSDIAETIRGAYQRVRLAMIVHTELEPRGLDLGSYYSSHQQLLPQVVQIIDQAMTNSNLGIEMLVAGFNGQTHAIFTILNPGTIHNNSPIGHGAIGSGAPHALYSLIANSYTASMDRDLVIDLVQKAKKQSEVAPGVGAKTTTVVIPKIEQDEDNA